MRVFVSGDNGRKALANLDTVDLEAIQVVSTWGISTNGPTERVKPVPCPRENCGGSILVFDGDRHCILCARVGGGAGIHDLPELVVSPYRPPRVNGWTKYTREG